VAGRLAATIKVGKNPQIPVFAAGAVWVPNGEEGTVSRIDPATNQVVATIPLGQAGNTNVLNPAAAAAAGARHGQLASGLPGGGLALSCHKLVEDGARTLILLAPGLFRLDVRPVEDTLQVMTRSLHELPIRWATEELDEQHLGRGYADRAEPSVLVFRLHLPAEPEIGGRLRIASTADRAAGVSHFVAHAIVRRAPGDG
jgi:YVTN family beta-propeller protein